MTMLTQIRMYLANRRCRKTSGEINVSAIASAAQFRATHSSSPNIAPLSAEPIIFHTASLVRPAQIEGRAVPENRSSGRIYVR